jgi:methionyl-tRNA formyltransferase
VRAVVVSAYPRRASHLARGLCSLGYEPLAVLTPRRREPERATAAASVPCHHASPAFPPRLDVLELRDKQPIPTLLHAYQPDVVVCWGAPWLVQPEALSVPPFGWLNLHPSALPKHRGPTPLPWALRAGDPVIGVTWHRMDSGFDTGPIFAQGLVPVSELDPTHPWEKLTPLAMCLLPAALARVEAGEAGDPQREADATYEGRFEFDEFARIDPARSTRDIMHQITAWRLAKTKGPFRGPVLELDGEDHRVVSVSLDEPRPPHRCPAITAADGVLWITKSVPLGCRLRAKGATGVAGEE